MAKHSQKQDRNFDDLAKRFQKNIYGGLKGEIRLAVLERDFRAHFPLALGESGVAKPLRILDAGGGQGQFSLHLAKAGHSVVICDISSEMLKLAEVEVTAQGLQERVQLVHCAIQDLGQHMTFEEYGFDLVLCHAVMEWVVDPQQLLAHVIKHVRPDGFLSVTFYNLHSLIYKNLLRTNFKKIQQQDYAGSRGSLTPINPLYPEQVFEWLEDLPLDRVATSGIRVFHDYILDEEQRSRDPQSILELELELSSRQPYQLLGRYIHLLCIKR